MGSVGRVDDDGIFDRFGCAGEFGEDYGTVCGGGLGDYVFNRGGVHAVTDGGDEAEIGDAEESVVFAGEEVLGVMLHGIVVEAAIVAVDF